MECHWRTETYSVESVDGTKFQLLSILSASIYIDLRRNLDNEYPFVAQSEWLIVSFLLALFLSIGFSFFHVLRSRQDPSIGSLPNATCLLAFCLLAFLYLLY